MLKIRYILISNLSAHLVDVFQLIEDLLGRSPNGPFRIHLDKSVQEQAISLGDVLLVVCCRCQMALELKKNGKRLV